MEIVDLIGKGAAIDIKNKNGDTPLMLAIKSGNRKLEAFLYTLQKLVSINNSKKIINTSQQCISNSDDESEIVEESKAMEYNQEDSPKNQESNIIQRIEDNPFPAAKSIGVMNSIHIKLGSSYQAFRQSRIVQRIGEYRVVKYAAVVVNYGISAIIKGGSMIKSVYQKIKGIKTKYSKKKHTVVKKKSIAVQLGIPFSRKEMNSSHQARIKGVTSSSLMNKITYESDDEGFDYCRVLRRTNDSSREEQENHNHRYSNRLSKAISESDLVIFKGDSKGCEEMLKTESKKKPNKKQSVFTLFNRAVKQKLQMENWDKKERSKSESITQIEQKIETQLQEMLS